MLFVTRDHCASAGRACLGLSLSLCLLTLSACDALTYEPSGENTVEVAPPVLPAGPLVQFAEGDTLEAWGETTVQYALDLENLMPLRVDVYLDGDSITTTYPDTETNGQFSFQSDAHGDGLHSMTLIVWARSGTGSLADRLGAEVVVGGNERPIRIDNAPPQPVAVISVTPADGTLHVRWKRYPRTRLRFVRYEVYRMTNPDGGNDWDYGSKRIATVTDPDQTVWKDVSYTGGSVAYRVAVVTAISEYETQRIDGRALSFDAPFSQIETHEVLGDGRVRLHWSATQFPANHKAYRLRRQPYRSLYYGEVPSGGEIVATITDPRTTSYVDQPPTPFGALYSYRIEAISDFDEEASFRGYFEVVQMDSPAPWHVPNSTKINGTFEAPVYLPAFDAYLVASDGGGLERYDATSLDRQGGNIPSAWRDSLLTVAPGGARAFQIDVTSGRRREIVYEYDLRSLARVASHDITSLLPSEYDVASLHATDGDRIFLGLSRYRSSMTYRNGAVAVVDLSSMTLLTLVEKPWHSFGGFDGSIAFEAVSPDGQYALVEEDGAHTIRRVSKEGLAVQSSFDGLPHSVRFFPDDFQKGADLGPIRKGGFAR